MKRIEFDRYGGPELMCLREFEPRALRPTDVRVRMRAAAINPVDWKIREGALRFMTGRRFPRGMGMEFSGVVEAIGAAVNRLRGGDEVFGAVPVKEAGAFAEALVTPQTLVAKKPAALSFEAAACLSVAPMAAWRGLVDKAHVAAGQVVFVAGCRGAVGRAAVQIARMHGAQVAGSCSARDIEQARALGIDPVLDYRTSDTASLDGRFDAVFDTAGQLSIAQGLALLKAGGGSLLDVNFTPARMLRGLFSPRYKVVMGQQDVAALETLAAAAANGRLKIDIGRTAPLQDALALLNDVEQGRVRGGRSVIVNGSLR